MNRLTSHYGKVIRTEGDIAYVRFERSEMCNHCNVCISSGAHLMEAKCKNPVHAKEGNTVTVSFERKNLLKASLIAYIIPLVLFVAGLLIGNQISELFSAILSIVFCAGSFFVLKMINRKIDKEGSYVPQIDSVIQ